MLAFIEDKEGADRVERILKKERAILPWLVLMEVHYVTRQEAGPGEADRRRRPPISGDRQKYQRLESPC